MERLHAQCGQSQGTALIVDDDEHVRALLASLARQFGFERTSEVAAGRGALERLEFDKISIVLVDLALEGEDGVALIRAIRAHGYPRVRALPVVVVSRCTDETRVRSSLEAGADGFVAKPLTTANFYRQVSSAVRKRAEVSRVESAAVRSVRRRDVFEIE